MNVGSTRRDLLVADWPRPDAAVQRQAHTKPRVPGRPGRGAPRPPRGSPGPSPRRAARPSRPPHQTSPSDRALPATVRCKSFRVDAERIAVPEPIIKNRKKLKREWTLTKIWFLRGVVAVGTGNGSNYFLMWLSRTVPFSCVVMKSLRMSINEISSLCNFNTVPLTRNWQTMILVSKLQTVPKMSLSFMG